MSIQGGPGSSCSYEAPAPSLHPVTTLPDFSDSTPKLSTQSVNVPDRRLHWSCYYYVPQSPPDHPSSSRPVYARCFWPPIPLTFPHALVYTPFPSLYLTQTTPPSLNHWWFSMRTTQLLHSHEKSPSLTHQPINLHLPTPLTIYTTTLSTLTSTPDMGTHGIVR